MADQSGKAYSVRTIRCAHTSPDEEIEGRLRAVVEPLDPADAQRLRAALGQLAEQDPLIDVRQDDTRAEISV